jgi:hypothetical protein
MKHASLLAILIFYLTVSTYAQSPQSIPYQAVARDIDGNYLSAQTISLRFTIHNNSPSGPIIYQETQPASTNKLGLFTANIGQGFSGSGNFSSINWRTGSKFLQVEIDAAGGQSYIDMGTQQMLSVPYSLFAENSAQWYALGQDIVSTNSGNVGIGEYFPGQKLHVAGSGIFEKNQNGETSVNINNSSTSSLSAEAIRFNDENGTVAGLIVNDILSSSSARMTLFNNRPGGNIQFATQGFPKLVINNSGNVGIGSDYPVNKLDLNGGLAVGAAYSGISSSPSNGAIIQGDVGIGTSIPAGSAKLEVASTTQGFLPPRMTCIQRDAISSPVQGLIIYCINCGVSGEPEFFNGTTWKNMIGGNVAPCISLPQN